MKPEISFCPNCSNPLEFSFRLKRWICGYCGYAEFKEGDSDEKEDYYG